MEKNYSDENPIVSFLHKVQIATLDELKKILDTRATMTTFRRLKSFGYLTSYSHRGKFYTLLDIPTFNEQGLWSYRSVWFSRYGNLSTTVKKQVDQSATGWTAQELENILHVEVKRPLLQLYKNNEIYREKIAGVYTYYSASKDIQRSQLLMRQEQSSEITIGLPAHIEALSHELKAGIILFFSLLDEQQRRLYAGLEAQKMGHGGDRRIAKLLDLDVHTVAKGRRELFGGNVQRKSIRKQGAGRKTTEKKHRISLNVSKK